MGRGNAAVKQHKASVSATGVDMKLEVHVIPVSDVERSKQFYQRLGWRFDADIAPADGIRIVQYTPPGSACSATFGVGITAAPPGSGEGTLVVADIVAAHDEVVGRGVEATEVWHGPPFLPRHDSAAPTPSAPVTDPISPSRIPTRTRG